MSATNMGTTLVLGNQKVIHGATITFSSYIVINSNDGKIRVAESEHEDEDGKLVAKVVYQRLPQVDLTLKSLAGAVPLSDFPQGSFCALTGLTTYWVDSCSVSKSKDPEQVSVSLTKIGITRYSGQ